MTERREIRNDGAAAAVQLGGPQQSFFVLRETPCPYLAGQRERKLVTELAGSGARSVYGTLSRAGFRRSHLFAYKPVCRGCAACVPVRIDACSYAPSKSQRRIARQNDDLQVTVQPATATREQFELFARYLNHRHPDGEMAAMTFADFRPMVEETAVDTRLAEFRDPAGELVAGALFDLMDDGISAVYTFFDPAASGRSLGTYAVHWLVGETVRRGGAYVYLGYWIAQSRKMAYKARFRPLEALTAGGWHPVQT